MTDELDSAWEFAMKDYMERYVTNSVEELVLTSNLETDPVRYQILRAHQLAEKTLDVCLGEMSEDLPKGFRAKIKAVKSSTNESVCDWLWLALERLDELANSYECENQFDTGERKMVIEGFVNLCKPTPIWSSVGAGKSEVLAKSLVVCCSCLWLIVDHDNASASMILAAIDDAD